jgi:hypothetical protein
MLDATVRTTGLACRVNKRPAARRFTLYRHDGRARTAGWVRVYQWGRQTQGKKAGGAGEISLPLNAIGGRRAADQMGERPQGKHGRPRE